MDSDFVGVGAKLGLVRCGGCPWLRQDVNLRDVGEAEVELAPGRHALTIYNDVDAETDVIVTLSRSAP